MSAFFGVIFKAALAYFGLVRRQFEWETPKEQQQKRKKDNHISKTHRQIHSVSVPKQRERSI